MIIHENTLILLEIHEYSVSKESKTLFETVAVAILYEWYFRRSKVNHLKFECVFLESSVKWKFWLKWWNHVNSWKHENSLKKHSWILMRIQDNWWKFKKIHECPWKSMRNHEIQLKIMKFHWDRSEFIKNMIIPGNSWKLMNILKFNFKSWKFWKIHWNLMKIMKLVRIHDNSRQYTDFIGNP